MKLIAVLLLTMSTLAPALADSPPTDSYTVWIQTILQDYSERTGTKFVLDPRVNMKAQLVGFEANDIDYPTLSRILLMHGYMAVKLDGVVYVVVDSASDEFLEKLAEKVED